jgi:hypothetical protein
LYHAQVKYFFKIKNSLTTPKKMKQLLFLAFLCTYCLATSAQESFKKKYKIPGWIRFSEKDTLYLVKDTLCSFQSLDTTLKYKIKQEYKSGQTLTVTKELTIGGEKRTITQQLTVDESFYNSVSQTLTKKVDTTKTPFKGFVKFEDNKVFVNPYLRKKNGEFGERDVYYFKLKNRQKIRLSFPEITVSTLTIPIKYRFKNGEIPEDFSTAFNANFFLGYSWGITSFFHQEKVDNKSNTGKFTTGLLLGASVTEINASNTKHAAEPLIGDVKYNKGLACVGLGATYSLNKINVGLFYGWDYAIGESADKWNYNKKPWLGVAVGYSLFNL